MISIKTTSEREWMRYKEQTTSDLELPDNVKAAYCNINHNIKQLAYENRPTSKLCQVA